MTKQPPPPPPPYSTSVSKTASDAFQAKYSAMNVGYGPMMVVQNYSQYQALLQQMAYSQPPRRQTPLVHAGYASRVLAISHAIHAYLQYHSITKTSQPTTLPVVLLGCGMDVIGFWAHSVCQSLMGGDINVNLQVIEVDRLDVCQRKWEVLVEQGLVDSTSQEERPNGTRVWRGRIRQPATATTTAAMMPQDSELAAFQDYTLCAMDLQDTTALDDLVDTFVVGGTGTQPPPVLAITELVLAYFHSAETTHRFLSWCASKLLAAPDSVFVALEPIAEEKTDNEEGTLGKNGVLSVTQGYQRGYSQQFRQKMDRGKHQQVTSAVSSFRPLGASVANIQDTMLNTGFAHAHVATLGEAAHQATVANPGITFAIPELFDEHAALALHLQSYALAVGFSKASGLLLRLVCPANFAATEIPPRIDSRHSIVYTTLEPCDEEQLRALFEETYRHFFEEYPAIRRMVQDIVDNDMAMTPTTASTPESAIVERYKAQGGNFLVALRFDPSSGSRQVVGCVGIRASEEREAPAGSLEIYRMVVDKAVRRGGVGRTLVSMAEQMTRLHSSSPKLYVVTLTIFLQAVSFYEALGYRMYKDVPIGRLTKRNFVKEMTE